MTEANSTTDPIEDALLYKGRLVVSWQSVAQFPEPAQLTTINESNEWFLRASSALNEQVPEISEEHVELAPELARLELKMNLLLELVGHTLSRQLNLPEPAMVSLSSRGMAWVDSQPPSEGEKVLMSLYLQPELPRPVQFYGTVLRNSGGETTVAFHGISQATEDWLDRFIFRHHRRSVAHSRNSQG